MSALPLTSTSTPTVTTTSTASPPDAGATPSAPLIVLLAASAGLGAASLYYSQPILAPLAEDLHASTGGIGAFSNLITI